MTTETLTSPAPLTKSNSKRTSLNLKDRCDRCNAQAFVSVTMEKSGTELLFCNHHFRAYESKITPLASHILDDSAKINAKPTSPEDDKY